MIKLTEDWTHSKTTLTWLIMNCHISEDYNQTNNKPDGKHPNISSLIQAQAPLRQIFGINLKYLAVTEWESSVYFGDVLDFVPNNI